MNRIYFQGLAEIRALAALFVIFHHLELYKFRDGISSLYNTQFNYCISHLGKNGVYMFFVLSGFLITYLLLFEKQQTNKIDIKKFYIRRILRIWPLYYLTIIISFTLIPLLAESFTAFQNETNYYARIVLLYESPYFTLLLFLLFLPNLALKIRPAVVGASQSWSVGVEEQFYIIWPHLINQIKKKYFLLLLLIGITALPVIIRIASLINADFGEYLSYILELIPIHFMAIGSIGAFFLFFYKRYIDIIFHNKALFIINSFVLIAILLINLKIPFKNVVFGFIFLAELLFIIQSSFKFNLRIKYLEKIGDISYGVYMYHPLMMYICFSFWNSILPIKNILAYNILIYSSTILSTLIISHISFNYFEKIFIKMKNKKFTIIQSGKTISNKT